MTDKKTPRERAEEIAGSNDAYGWTKGCEMFIALSDAIEQAIQAAVEEEREETMIPRERAEEVKERLAAIEHERWADWQQHVFNKSEILPDGTAIIPDWAVTHWMRQIVTEYDKLTEKEKDSDRREVDRYLPIIEQAIQAAVEEERERCAKVAEASKGKRLLSGDMCDYIAAAMRGLK